MMTPKKKKAQDGDNIKRTEFNKDKELSNVTKKESFGESMKRFYKSDPAKADQAKTKAGKVARKALNTVTKVAFTPARAAFSAVGAVDKAMTEAKDKKAMKMGGKMKKKMSGLKPVPAGKKGLAKLPTPVRNKMGFQKNGGKTKK